MTPRFKLVYGKGAEGGKEGGEMDRGSLGVPLGILTFREARGGGVRDSRMSPGLLNGGKIMQNFWFSSVYYDEMP